MPTILDLGGAPAEAECAQLGQTTNFAAVNSFEVEAYRLAIIARYGAPPAGCRLAELANDHDFGTYRGHDTKVSFAYARSEQNVSVNPLCADLVRQAVKTGRCRTL